MTNSLFSHENVIFLQKELNDFGRCRGKLCPFILKIRLLATIKCTVEKRKKIPLVFIHFVLDKMRMSHNLKWCTYWYFIPFPMS